MTAVAVPYSALAQAQADAQQLLLIVDPDARSGHVIEVYPRERPDVIFSSVWQPEPGAQWRAIRSFLDPEPTLFDSADDAILFALTGGPITERPAYLWGRKTTRR